MIALGPINTGVPGGVYLCQVGEKEVK